MKKYVMLLVLLCCPMFLGGCTEWLVAGGIGAGVVEVMHQQEAELKVNKANLEQALGDADTDYQRTRIREVLSEVEDRLTIVDTALQGADRDWSATDSGLVHNIVWAVGALGLVWGAIERTLKKRAEGFEAISDLKYKVMKTGVNQFIAEHPDSTAESPASELYATIGKNRRAAGIV